MIGHEDCTATADERCPPQPAEVCLWVVEYQAADGNWHPLSNRAHAIHDLGQFDLDSLRKIHPRINFRLKMYVPDDD